MKLGKRVGFLLGGMAFAAMVEAAGGTYKELEYTSDFIGAFFGVVIMGAIYGLIAYAIFGREKKK